jgi:anti-sigma28 factor (negative regulator of flagellin synthesis)
MQISSQEVYKVQEKGQKSPQASEAPVQSVEELADKHGVKMDEVRRFTERALMAEEDPARAKRVQELAARVASGSYHVEAEAVLDMAERRAIADRSGDL